MHARFGRFAGTQLWLVALAALIVVAQPSGAAEVCALNEDPPGSERSSQNGLQWLMGACPMLTKDIERMALQDLGEAEVQQRSRTHVNALLVASAFLSTKNPTAALRFAKEAVAAGASREDVAEIVYRTAARDGVVKAAEVAVLLADLIERPAKPKCSQRTNNS